MIQSPRPHASRTAGVVLMAFALLGAACGSSKSASTTTTTVPLDSATAPTLIGRSYETLFNLSVKTVTDKIAVIQDGASVRTALSQAMASSLSNSSTGARVDTTVILQGPGCTQQHIPSPCAKVTYDILGATGQPLLPTPSTGYAVYADGTWLVAKTTICSLLGLFYSASGKSGTPPGC
ncbi:MAG: hypothetical protein ACYDD6_07540 [Acidimicrobiales bacterium]